MADILRRGTEWLNAKRKANMTELVTYNRVTGSSASLLATRAKNDPEQLIETELVSGALTQDWILEAIDLEVAGSFVQPRKGDRITVDGQTWEVSEIGNDGKCWRYSDQFQLMVRIFTVLS